MSRIEASLSVINMDQILSSDDSCDSEVKIMKNELTEYGLEEENLSKEEMSDLLKALKNSKSTNQEEDETREKEKVEATPDDLPQPVKILKRRYLNVKDRRMPWSLLPGTLDQAEKARTLAVYIKLMSINKYRQARQSSHFATWPPPIQIVEESTRIQPMRSTRSGRSVPIYSGFDEDSSDFDFVVTRPKRRKVSSSDTNDGVYTNKIISLKRKTLRDENSRPAKDSKIIELPENNLKTKKDLFTFIED